MRRLVAAAALVAAAVGATGGAAGAVPPGPQSITVTTESEYRAALTTLSGITAEEGAQHTIVLGADITLTQTGQGPTYGGQTNLRIQGDGHTVDAAGISRVLTSGEQGVGVELDGVTAKNGFIHNAGGAVFSYGDLTLRHSRIEDSHGGLRGGGVAAYGALLVEDSVISGNTVTPPYVGSTQADGGGAYGADGVTIIRSTISGNTADQGGGFQTLTEVQLTDSTVSGNTADGEQGIAGGFVGGRVTIDNSTVTGNTAEQIGGIFARRSITATLTTIAGNTTTTGPANVRGDGDASWSLFGTVIADPVGGDNCLVAGTHESQFTYADDDSCELDAGTDVADGADPELGPLADNGGSTETLLPRPGSPLLDRIDPLACAGRDVDQRGEPRPEVDGTNCDVGAVEGSGLGLTCLGEPVTVDLGQGDSPTAEDDVILGTPGPDVIDALGGDDLVCGLGGNDSIVGGAGVDHVSGGYGADDVGGGLGADLVEGNQGIDDLFGANGNDRLVGGDGNDNLSGGPADDHLVGGDDTDRCDGGAGTDSRQTCEALLGFP